MPVAVHVHVDRRRRGPVPHGALPGAHVYLVDLPHGHDAHSRAGGHRHRALLRLRERRRGREHPPRLPVGRHRAALVPHRGRDVQEPERVLLPPRQHDGAVPDTAPRHHHDQHRRQDSLPLPAVPRRRGGGEQRVHVLCRGVLLVGVRRPWRVHAVPDRPRHLPRQRRGDCQLALVAVRRGRCAVPVAVPMRHTQRDRDAVPNGAIPGAHVHLGPVLHRRQLVVCSTQRRDGHRVRDSLRVRYVAVGVPLRHHHADVVPNRPRGVQEHECLLRARREHDRALQRHDPRHVDDLRRAQSDVHVPPVCGRRVAGGRQRMRRVPGRQLLVALRPDGDDVHPVPGGHGRLRGQHHRRGAGLLARQPVLHGDAGVPLAPCLRRGRRLCRRRCRRRYRPPPASRGDHLQLGVLGRLHRPFVRRVRVWVLSGHAKTGERTLLRAL